MAEHVITGANSNVKGTVEMGTLKPFECRDSAVDTDAEFRQRMVLLYREMRADSEPDNDAGEMRETTGGVAFLVGAPLLIVLFALFAVTHQNLLREVVRSLGF